MYKSWEGRVRRTKKWYRDVRTNCGGGGGAGGVDV